MPRQSKKKSLDTSTVIRLSESSLVFLTNDLRTAARLLDGVASSLDYEIPKETLLNHIGTLVSVYSHIATMETRMLTLAQAAAPTKKLKLSPGRRRASTSIRSTRKRAKLARTGKKSNRLLSWDEFKMRNPHKDWDAYSRYRQAWQLSG
jgi:hypothetical protein